MGSSYNTKSAKVPRWERYDFDWIHPIYGTIKKRRVTAVKVEYEWEFRVYPLELQPLFMLGPFYRVKEAQDAAKAYYDANVLQEACAGDRSHCR